MICGITAVGTIVWGHREQHTPRWRRIGKIVVLCGLSVLVSSTAERFWFFVLLGVLAAIVLLIHAWWLPRNGINGWTGEPREKYYALRGWKWPPERQ